LLLIHVTRLARCVEVFVTQRVDSDFLDVNGIARLLTPFPRRVGIGYLHYYVTYCTVLTEIETFACPIIVWLAICVVMSLSQSTNRGISLTREPALAQLMMSEV
jgi:hypothetical protein